MKNTAYEPNDSQYIKECHLRASLASVVVILAFSGFTGCSKEPSTKEIENKLNVAFAELGSTAKLKVTDHKVLGVEDNTVSELIHLDVILTEPTYKLVPFESIVTNPADRALFEGYRQACMQASAINGFSVQAPFNPAARVLHEVDPVGTVQKMEATFAFHKLGDSWELLPMGGGDIIGRHSDGVSRTQALASALGQQWIPESEARKDLEMLKSSGRKFVEDLAEFQAEQAREAAALREAALATASKLRSFEAFMVAVPTANDQGTVKALLEVNQAGSQSSGQFGGLFHETGAWDVTRVATGTIAVNAQNQVTLRIYSGAEHQYPEMGGISGSGGVFDLELAWLGDHFSTPDGRYAATPMTPEKIQEFKIRGEAAKIAFEKAITTGAVFVGYATPDGNGTPRKLRLSFKSISDQRAEVNLLDCDAPAIHRHFSIALALHRLNHPQVYGVSTVNEGVRGITDDLFDPRWIDFSLNLTDGELVGKFSYNYHLDLKPVGEAEDKAWQDAVKKEYTRQYSALEPHREYIGTISKGSAVAEYRVRMTRLEEGGAIVEGIIYSDRLPGFERHFKGTYRIGFGSAINEPLQIVLAAPLHNGPNGDPLFCETAQVWSNQLTIRMHVTDANGISGQCDFIDSTVNWRPID